VLHRVSVAHGGVSWEGSLAEVGNTDPHHLPPGCSLPYLALAYHFHSLTSSCLTFHFFLVPNLCSSALRRGE
jgi:hypothetical protein